MRYVTLPGTDLKPSILGFGCASLGSRVGRDQGLEALERAHDLGVTWYDVAPVYGAGEAENILSEFLRPRRGEVFVCTKLGLSLPRHKTALKLAYRIARPFAAPLQKMRATLRKVVGTQNQKVALSPAFVEQSVENSLKRLGVETIDVILLHAPDPADVQKDEICRALERVIERGQARYAGVAGDTDAAMAAAKLGAPYSVIQIADDPFDPSLEDIKAAAQREIAFITHSVLGIHGAFEKLSQTFLRDTALQSRLEQMGYSGPSSDAAANLLLDRAFAVNNEGVVLASMFSEAHLRNNVQRASEPVVPAVPRFFDDLTHAA